MLLKRCEKNPLLYPKTSLLIAGERSPELSVMLLRAVLLHSKHLRILLSSRRAPSMTATSSFVSHRFESWEKLQNSHIPFIRCCIICVFVSVWDCFLLFCEHKKNIEKNCGSFGLSCQSSFIKKSKVKILVIRWPLAGTHSSTKLNEWEICSFLTTDLRGWVPCARWCTQSSCLLRFLGSIFQKQPPFPFPTSS